MRTICARYFFYATGLTRNSSTYRYRWLFTITLTVKGLLLGRCWGAIKKDTGTGILPATEAGEAFLETASEATRG